MALVISVIIGNIIRGPILLGENSHGHCSTARRSAGITGDRRGRPLIWLTLTTPRASVEPYTMVGMDHPIATDTGSRILTM